MAFCSCLGTGAILGLIDQALLGLCASAETTGACTNTPLPQQGPAVSGLTDTGPSSKPRALHKCSEYPDPGFTRNCYSVLLPAVLASVGVCAMGVLCSCVQGRAKRPDQRRPDRLPALRGLAWFCGGSGGGRSVCRCQEVRLWPALQSWRGLAALHLVDVFLSFFFGLSDASLLREFGLLYLWFWQGLHTNVLPWWSLNQRKINGQIKRRPCWQWRLGVGQGWGGWGQGSPLAGHVHCCHQAVRGGRRCEDGSGPC